MAGIINYYHGESGNVTDCWWSISGDFLAFNIELAGDPHRSLAWDYGSDIGIDPEIQPGDDVVYFRLEDTTGIWVRSDLHAASELGGAIDRVLQNRILLEKWRRSQAAEDYAGVARTIYETTGNPLRVTGGDATEGVISALSAGWAILMIGPALDERPQASASFFLSHAAEDTLLARRIFEDVKSEANADVWFDLAQPEGGVPESDGAVAEWLQNSIHDVDGFVVLWTEYASRSEWVNREIRWAQEKKLTRSEFRIIILKLRDVDVATDIQSDSLVVDCDDIWWSNGISEELYAAVFKRQGRRGWLKELPVNAPVSRGTTIGYSDFVSDSGVVVAFDWTAHVRSDAESPEKEICWRLDYLRRDGRKCRAEGRGEDQPVDLSLKVGDRVGFFKVRWRHGMHILKGPELWMRSADLAITSDTVLDEYFQELQENPS